MTDQLSTYPSCCGDHEILEVLDARIVGLRSELRRHKAFYAPHHHVVVMRKRSAKGSAMHGAPGADSSVKAQLHIPDNSCAMRCQVSVTRVR